MTTGRFTRRKLAATGKFSSKGAAGDISNWWCYRCLPPGEGRDEDQQTANQERSKVVAKVAQVLPATKPEKQAEIKRDGLALVSPLQLAVNSLEVTDQESYLEADSLLARVRVVRKQWGTRMEGIIRPIRQGLDEVYGLNRDVDRPLEALEKSIKQVMGDFKLGEQRVLQAAQEAQRIESERLRREAEEKAWKATEAATPKLRERLQQQAAILEQKAVDVEAAEQPQAVVGLNSSSRKVKKWRVTDIKAFAKGVVDGYIPENCLLVNHSTTDVEFKNDPEGFECWPGVETFDDVQIVGR